MITLVDLIQYLITLCNVAAGARILYCLVRMKADQDEAPTYIKRIIHVLMFLVLANTALGTMVFIRTYYV
jgi:hypothetical protein